MKVCEITIKDLVRTGAKTSADLARIKRKMAKKHKTACISNIELLKAYHKLVKNRTPHQSRLWSRDGTGQGIKKSEILENLLRTRPVRSLSGIVNVSVLTKPYPCPGKCIYCPIQKGSPKSYLKNEPAVMRAILNKYDPSKQVQMRLRALKITGHPTDKIDLRIIGGTWSYYPKNYQNWFIKRCFDACNNKKSKNQSTKQKVLCSAEPINMGSGLKEAQKLNEKAKHRIVGLSIETRPDFIRIEEIKRLRELGVTMVELGVQSVYDDVLKLNKRGHKVKSTILATKLLKEAGFKVLYQMMPNLPGSNPRRDEKMFKELFSNPDFQPDYLKIYPCAILKEAPLYKLWRTKKYKPYTEKQLINLVKSIKKQIPYYVRIQRITRDIPSQSVVAGPAKISNLRQILAGLSKNQGWKCKCIRCREIRENYSPKEKLYLYRQDYNASGGKEIFLSYEDKKREKIYSLLRLRIPSQKETLPALRGAVLIREVHTYGQMTAVGKKSLSAQHRGLGKKLIKEAERIAKKGSASRRIAVISGIGVRGYYRKLGYRLKDSYMIKNLN